MRLRNWDKEAVEILEFFRRILRGTSKEIGKVKG